MFQSKFTNNANSIVQTIRIHSFIIFSYSWFHVVASCSSLLGIGIGNILTKNEKCCYNNEHGVVRLGNSYNIINVALLGALL